MFLCASMYAAGPSCHRVAPAPAHSTSSLPMPAIPTRPADANGWCGLVNAAIIHRLLRYLYLAGSDRGVAKKSADQSDFTGEAEGIMSLSEGLILPTFFRSLARVRIARHFRSKQDIAPTE